MKKGLTLLLFLLAFVSAGAQDTLFNDNERYLLGYVQGREHLFYVKFFTVENTDTVYRSIRTGRLLQIVYEDGSIWKRMSQKKLAKIRKASRPVQPKQNPSSYSNALTLNVLTYNNIGNFPGISIGIEYDRVLGKEGHFSAAFSAHYLWAGTPEHGKMRPGETRSNIQAGFFILSAFYHPAGNTHLLNPSFGLAVPIGNVSRIDHTEREPGKPYNYVPRATHTFAALLLQANLTLQPRGRFSLTTYASYGPMLPTGNTIGGFGQAGLRVGFRF